MDKRYVVIVASAIILFLFFLAILNAFVIGMVFIKDEPYKPPPTPIYDYQFLEFTGDSTEMTEESIVFRLNHEEIRDIDVYLQWEDEDMSYYNISSPMYENKGDELGLYMTLPNGRLRSSGLRTNHVGTSGTANIHHYYYEDDGDTSGVYNVTVECGDCGDVARRLGHLPFTIVDSWVEWELNITVKYISGYEED